MLYVRLRVCLYNICTPEVECVPDLVSGLRRAGQTEKATEVALET